MFVLQRWIDPARFHFLILWAESRFFQKGIVQSAEILYNEFQCRVFPFREICDFQDIPSGKD